MNTQQKLQKSATPSKVVPITHELGTWHAALRRTMGALAKVRLGLSTLRNLIPVFKLFYQVPIHFRCSAPRLSARFRAYKSNFDSEN